MSNIWQQSSPSYASPWGLIVQIKWRQCERFSPRPIFFACGLLISAMWLMCYYWANHCPDHAWLLISWYLISLYSSLPERLLDLEVCRYVQERLATCFEDSMCSPALFSYSGSAKSSLFPNVPVRLWLSTRFNPSRIAFVICLTCYCSCNILTKGCGSPNSRDHSLLAGTLPCKLSPLGARASHVHRSTCIEKR